MGPGEVRVERDGAAVFGDRLVGLPLHAPSALPRLLWAAALFGLSCDGAAVFGDRLVRLAPDPASALPRL